MTLNFYSLTIMRNNTKSIGALGYPKAMTHLVIALEEDKSGKALDENEYVIYGILTNRDALANASRVIHQSQATLKYPNGSIRIRKTVEDGVIDFISTAKEFIPNGGRKEASIGSSQAQYDIYCKLAGERLDKVRYTFPTGVFQDAGGEERELMWEVDVFQGTDGKDHNWIKIDLEYYQPLDTLPGLPVILENMIFSLTNEYSAEEKGQIKKLYSSVWPNAV